MLEMTSTLQSTIVSTMLETKTYFVCFQAVPILENVLCPKRSACTLVSTLEGCKSSQWANIMPRAAQELRIIDVQVRLTYRPSKLDLKGNIYVG